MNQLTFNLDFRSGVPGYVQIVEQVQAHLAQGKLVPGDQLPTVRQLAAELRVNFNTVARAYRILDEAGLISTQQGRGTYIMDLPNSAQSQAIKAKTLEDQIRSFIETLKQQGYQPEEADTVLRKAMEAWKTETFSNNESESY